MVLSDEKIALNWINSITKEVGKENKKVPKKSELFSDTFFYLGRANEKISPSLL